MLLFLVRHAEAVDESRALPDPSRHLTSRGRAQARALGERLRPHGCAPAVLWTSPLTRAVQTAELVAAGLGHAGDVIAEPLLAPDADPRELAARLSALPPATVALAVGHEPGLSGLLGAMIGDPTVPSLRKAEATCTDGFAALWWLAHDEEAPVADADRRTRW